MTRTPALFLDDPRRERLAVAILLLVALALRVVWVFETRASPFFDQPILDGAYHVGLARSFAFGGPEYHPGPFFRAPLYPWFLGATFWLFGENYLIPRLLQALLSTGTVLLTYLLGRRTLGKGPGYLAGWLAATYWVLIYFDGQLLLETQSVFLNTLALWLTLRLADAPGGGRAFLAGITWGLGAITRPSVLLFMPAAFFWLLARARAAGLAGRPRWVPALALTAGTLAPILPITAWNTWVEGDFVLIASQGGSSLWIGNNPVTDGATAIVPGTRGGWWQGYQDTIALAEREAGRPLRASEVSQHYARKAWRFLLGEPGKSIPILLHKLRLFVYHRELGNNHDPHFDASHFSHVLGLLPTGFSLVLPLGLLGMVVTRRRGSWWWLLVAYVAIYAAGVIAFFVNSRFRLQILPPLFVFGAAALYWLAATARARRLVPLGLGCTALAAGVVLCNLQPPGILTDASGGTMQLGYAEAGRGNLALGRRLIERSLEINPANSYAWIRLGEVQEQMGEVRAAIDALRTALDRDPYNVDAVEALLALHERHQQLAESEHAAAQALRIVPQAESPYYHLARVRRQQKRDDEAIQLARDGLARDRTSFRCALLLGVMLGDRGDHAAAVEALDQAFAARERGERDGHARLLLAFERSLGALGRSARLAEVRAALGGAPPR